MKKFNVAIIFSLGFILTILFNPISGEAATKSNCSDSYVRCQAVTIYKGNLSGTTNSIYVPKNGSIYFTVETFDDSLFQVGAYLYDENLKLIYSLGASGSGGVNWKTITAPSSGNYHVVLKSGDTTLGRSHARAYLSYAYR